MEVKRITNKNMHSDLSNTGRHVPEWMDIFLQTVIPPKMAWIMKIHHPDLGLSRMFLDRVSAHFLDDLNLTH